MDFTIYVRRTFFLYGEQNHKLNSFWEVFNFKWKIDVGEVILNVVICVPLGIYTGVLFKRWNFGSKVFFFFLVSLMLKDFRLYCVWHFDMTDIITNTSGGIIGIIIFYAIEKSFNNSDKARKFINIIAAVGTLLMISMLCLLKLNMLPVRYQ